MKKSTIGGQGVLNGIMMRSPERSALAVRKDDGDIALEVWENKNHDSIWYKIPVIRGVLNFVEMLYNGTRVLMESSKLSEAPEDEYEPSKFDRAVGKALGVNPENVMLSIAVVISLLLTIGLFFLLPTAVTSLLKGVLKSEILFNLVEGAVRITIFLTYIFLVSKMAEIKTVFRYHGAEHKTITCYENELPLDSDHAVTQTRLHPRCGTSYLLIVMIFSTLVYSVFHVSQNFILKVLLKLALLPLIAGCSYELLKLLAKSDNICFRILRWPGLQLQRLTTAEPSKDIIDVAILAFEAALGEKSAEELENMRKSFSLKKETENEQNSADQQG